MLVSKVICDELNDQDIVRKALAEEMDYFSCLYERYAARLRRYIRRLTLTSEEEAADILQEAFIRIWTHLHDYDSRFSLSTWLYRIVHNQAISFLRRKKAFGRDQTIPWNETLLPDVADDDGADTAEALQLQDRRTHAVLAQLPLPYQEVLLLKFFENMTYEEISDVLKIPEGTVATRINRAKKVFAEQSKSVLNSN